MPRGGARKGAGRPKNTPNKATQSRQAAAAKTGKMPCDVLIELMRHAYALCAKHAPNGTNPNPELHKEFSRFAAEAAKAAAPYYHPKLSTQTVVSTGDPSKPVVHRFEVEFV